MNSTSSGMVVSSEIIREGACYRMHDSGPKLIPCLASYQSMMQGVVCSFMFFYMLKKINKAHKRALAGYAKNTINITSHGHAFFGCIVFYVVWGIGCFFDLNRDYKYRALDSPGLSGMDVVQLTPLILGATICRSFTNFLESYIVVLLISDSIGKDTFRRAMLISVFLTLFYVPSILVVIIWYPGSTSIYWPLRNLAILYLVRDVITVGYHFAAYRYTRNRKSVAVNNVISTYLLFMCCMYSAYILARCCYLGSDYVAVNFGICVDDLLHFVQFGFFGPFVYLALKRDCQYWATDIDNENELTLMSHTENMAWSEINDKNDAIIPKTEIYYRKTIEERCDVSVEIHFWRRRQVVVKRFKLDLLTRDNIKYFKDEASVFKTLHHPNVIAFYGILVDPPSLGIVMQWASRGDLFKYLEERLKSWRSDLLSGADGKTNGAAWSGSGSGSGGDDCQPKNTSKSAAAAAAAAAVAAAAAAAATTVSSERESIQEGDEADEDDDESDTIPPPLSPGGTGSIMSGGSPRLLTPGTPNSSGGFNSGSGSRQRSPSFMTRLTRTSFFAGTPQSPASTLSALEMANRVGQFHSIRCALQIALGMNYLHNKDVCHRDLKSLNILLDENFNAMIADFGESKFEEDIQFRDSTTTAAGAGASAGGLSALAEGIQKAAHKLAPPLRSALGKFGQAIGIPSLSLGGRGGESDGGADEEQGNGKQQHNTHHHHRGEVGTPGWAAPECLEGSMATKSSDVFSFGIILWELCTWIHPSVHVPVFELIRPPLNTLPGVEEWLAEATASVDGSGAEGAAGGGGGDDNAQHSHGAAANRRHNRHSIGRIISSLIGEDADAVWDKATSGRHSLEKRISQMSPNKLILIDACDAHRARLLMLEGRRRPPLPPKSHPLLANIMTRCWATDQAIRPTFVEIISDLQRVLGDLEREGDFDAVASFPLGLGLNAGARAEGNQKETKL